MTHKQSSVETDISGIKIMIIYSSKKLRSGAKSQIFYPYRTSVFTGNVYHLIEVTGFKLVAA